MEQDAIDLLKELVAIDSQNPSLVPGATGESQVAAYVADWAKGAGLTAEIMAETPGRPSVVVRSGGSSARSLLLCGHLDTVGVDAIATTGKPAQLAGASYWADAAFIAAAGIPTVLFGPDGDGAHAREEWVSLPGTVACARALIAAALDFCGG